MFQTDLTELNLSMIINLVMQSWLIEYERVYYYSVFFFLIIYNYY